MQKNQKVVILAGGFGSRLFEETISVPKPLVDVQGQPLIWHNMNRFSKFGWTEFIICMGHKSGELISFFKDQSCDIIEETKEEITIVLENGWKILLVETGEETMTGGRIKRVKELLTEIFFIAYSDNLSNINIDQLFDSFQKINKSCILTGVQPRLPYGIIHSQGEQVIGFSEKPVMQDLEINAGYFVCNHSILKHIKDDFSVFETDVMNALIEEKELYIFRHSGFWKSVDTYKDLCEAREMKNLLPLLHETF